jgi:hypothetical protein
MKRRRQKTGPSLHSRGSPHHSRLRQRRGGLTDCALGDRAVSVPASSRATERPRDEPDAPCAAADQNHVDSLVEDAHAGGGYRCAPIPGRGDVAPARSRRASPMWRRRWGDPFRGSVGAAGAPAAERASGRATSYRMAPRISDRRDLHGNSRQSPPVPRRIAGNPC